MSAIFNGIIVAARGGTVSTGTTKFNSTIVPQVAASSERVLL